MFHAFPRLASNQESFPILVAHQNDLPSCVPSLANQRRATAAAVVAGASGRYLSGYPPSAVRELEIVHVDAVVRRETLDDIEAVPRVNRFALFYIRRNRIKKNG